MAAINFLRINSPGITIAFHYLFSFSAEFPNRVLLNHAVDHYPVDFFYKHSNRCKCEVKVSETLILWLFISELHSLSARRPTHIHTHAPGHIHNIIIAPGIHIF